MTTSNDHNLRPILFGEVLFDSFPDGVAVLGGAPFNVAWHLQGFGANPYFISAVGDDDHGHEVIDKMSAWGMDVHGVQMDPVHPTGTVQITLDNGQPSYNILPDQAYDYITHNAMDSMVAKESGALFYHGSLAIRQTGSHNSFYTLQNEFSIPSFVDINLRSPWWNKSSVQDILSRARWAKLNDEELLNLYDDKGSLEACAQALLSRYQLELLIVTKGAEGAMLLDHSGVINGEPVPVIDMMDTVGAGDAFSSVMLLGMLKGWSHQASIQRALAFASRVCAERGALIHDKSIYQSYIDQWKML